MSNLPALVLISDINSDFRVANTLGLQVFPQGFPSIPNPEAMKLLNRFQGVYPQNIMTYGDRVFKSETPVDNYQNWCGFLRDVLASVKADAEKLKDLIPIGPFGQSLTDVLHSLIDECTSLGSMIPLGKTPKAAAR